MRFMSIYKSVERNAPPDPEEFTRMGALIEEMTKAGALQSTGGLMSTQHGARIHFKGGKRTITDGPFAESKEFLAGYWMVDVENAERAYAIAGKASTAPGPGGKPLGIKIEVRQVMSAPPDSLCD